MIPPLGITMLQRLFDSGLDEMAAGAHASTASCIAAAIGVGAIALAFLPWQLCAPWFAVAVSVELISWACTKEQFLGRTVSMGVRLQHAACVVAGVAAWVTLGELFWGLGTTAGAVCASVLWMAVLGFAQVYAYQ